MLPDLEVHVEQRGDVATVRVACEIDLSTSKGKEKFMRITALCFLGAIASAIISGCMSPSPGSSTITGTIDQSTFTAAVSSIAILSDSGAPTTAAVADDGSFTLTLQEGASYRFTLGADDTIPLVVRSADSRLQTQVAQAVSDHQRIAAALATSEKYERDVQIGRQIQASFLPQTLPQVANWEIAARFQPAREVAGDWYDAFQLTHGRVGLVIADVCDKGVGAALFMALMRSLIRAYAQQNYALRWLDALASDDIVPARTSTPGEGRRLPPSVGVTWPASMRSKSKCLHAVF